MDKKERKNQIDICLDEIEAAYGIMNKSKSSKKTLSNCRGWVRRHKAILKELKYKGKVPRQPRIMKKYAKDENLFTEGEEEACDNW